MKLSPGVKSFLGNVLALAFLVCTFVAVQSMGEKQDRSAVGQLTRYMGSTDNALNLVVTYPSDFYPGEGKPLYPGDEKWSGLDPYNAGNYYGNKVRGLSTDGKYIYAGSIMPAYVGDTQPIGVARWDMQIERWQRITPGDEGIVKGDVLTTAVFNNQLYIGGSIFQAGTLPVHAIANWNGSQWQHVAGGMTSTSGETVVTSLAVGNNSLYAGGVFTSAGGTPAYNIARWDGASWNALGSGINGKVNAIAISGSDVYAAGEFTMAGMQGAYSIARWDGTTWHPLGSGLNGPVTAIGVGGGKVYAGGLFTTAGGVPATHMAYWDGTQWHAMGEGTLDEIYAIKATPTGAYFGGTFVMKIPGKLPMINVAYWSGNAWTNLGSGIVGGVLDILLMDYRAFFSGWMYIAGNNQTTSFAAWNTQPTVVVFDTASEPIRPGSTIDLYGRYFTAGQPVTLTINGQPIGRKLYTNEDGKVSIRLALGPNLPEGDYPFSLTSGSQTASSVIPLRKNAWDWHTLWAGDDVYFPQYIRLPMIVR